jgi:hypothetical protein
VCQLGRSSRLAATGYGNHVAVEMAAVLAEHGVRVESFGAYGTNSQQVGTVEGQATAPPGPRTWSGRFAR